MTDPKEENVIKGFFGDYRFLSNYHYGTVRYDGESYRTLEHAFQAAKTLDLQQRKAIKALTTPKQARIMGQTVTLREDWETIKKDVMLELVTDKFSSNSLLAQHLLDTGEKYLEETNTWGDKYWGVCDGEGENHLGHILMKVRSKLC